MQIFQFEQATGQEITLFGSEGFVLSRLARPSAQAVVSVAHLLPNSVIGRHQAIGDQLFLVVWGAGSVSGEAGEEVPIIAGQAVLWGDGEWHETRTVGGLTAVIIEAPTINLAE
ncbi:MAG: cupin domain-containing protein [Anaerolineales bacterium]|nr:cupin domain-containing protein [Anaerolineales bacterium]MCB8991065.1 cupin domain-containing protein [Ardenticatenaceae bacterium]MCB9004107.1 cupin domain-containing protein [Ardenticatenaceae bacterium]